RALLERLPALRGEGAPPALVNGLRNGDEPRLGERLRNELEDVGLKEMGRFAHGRGGSTRERSKTDHAPRMSEDSPAREGFPQRSGREIPPSLSPTPAPQGTQRRREEFTAEDAGD